jgi:superfamily II DNA or RNA helicase
MRITGNDKDGQDQLGNFIDPESTYPVLVTTSRLLSTGVDAQTCRLIVLDRDVGSMTEFKQIVGRGTRVHEDTKKFYFTLIDFRGASSHFADPDFDGEPVQTNPGRTTRRTARGGARRRGRQTLPDKPCAEKPSSSPRPHVAPHRQRKGLCRWYRRDHHCRTGGIPGREQQARHGIPARFTRRR